MDIRDLIVQYGFFAGRRFRWKQKVAFLNYIGSDFQKLGYAVQGQLSDKRKNYAMNLIVGDLANAKKIVVAHYDTPQRSFFPIKYYPMNEMKSFKASYLLTSLPYLVLLFGIFILVYVFNESFGLSGFNLETILTVLAVITIAGLSILASIGIGNRMNLRRNSLAVVTVFALAEQLKGKKDIAFVLTDREVGDHEGDRMIGKALPKTLKERLVVHLHCLGVGPVVGVGYTAENKAHAASFAKVAEQKHEIFLKEMSEKETRGHSLFHYPKAITISTGEVENDEILVRNTSTKKDADADIDFLYSTIDCLLNFLK